MKSFSRGLLPQKGKGRGFLRFSDIAPAPAA